SHSLSVSSCSAQVRPPPESTFFPYTTLFRSGCQGIELGEEGLRIEHDAVADDAHGALDDPRRNLVQHELAGPGVDGVAGVGAPLVAHDKVGALGEHVDDLALALVAPLGADDDDAMCLRSEHSAPTKTPRGTGRVSILRRKLDQALVHVNALVHVKARPPLRAGTLR